MNPQPAQAHPLRLVADRAYLQQPWAVVAASRGMSLPVAIVDCQTGSAVSVTLLYLTPT